MRAELGQCAGGAFHHCRLLKRVINNDSSDFPPDFSTQKKACMIFFILFFLKNHPDVNCSGPSHRICWAAYMKILTLLIISAIFSAQQK